MTLYEFNQAGYSNMPDMTEEQIQKARQDIVIPFLEKHPSSYYLLLNNDQHYYTFFVFNEFSVIDNLAGELVTLAQELGPIKSIEVSNDGEFIEFWISYDNSTEAFMFFDYQRGVIEIP